MKTFVLLNKDYDEPLLAVTCADDEEQAKRIFLNVEKDDIWSASLSPNEFIYEKRRFKECFKDSNTIILELKYGHVIRVNMYGEFY
jgi:hypothetical protein